MTLDRGRAKEESKPHPSTMDDGRERESVDMKTVRLANRRPSRSRKVLELLLSGRLEAPPATMAALRRGERQSFARAMFARELASRRYGFSSDSDPE
jgi:hypothetical protein